MLEKMAIRLKNNISKIKSWRPGQLAKGTVIMTFGMGIRTLGQGLVFLILAHVLGAPAYGSYVAVLALSTIFGGFVGLGASVVMLRDTSRTPELFSERWGNSLAALALTSPILLLTYFVITWVFIPQQISWIVVVCVGLSEVVLTPFTVSSMQAFQAHERIGYMMYIVLAPVITRIVAALSLLVLFASFPPEVRLSYWGVLYLLSSMLVALYTARLLNRDLDVKFGFQWRTLRQVVSEGWQFSITSSSQKIFTDIDKIMLARILTLEITGFYAAAYRIIEISTVPLLSFFSVLATRLSRMGGEGNSSAFLYTLRIMPLVVFYASILGLIIHSGAWIVPWVLGKRGFSHVVLVLHWLAWLPLISMTRRFIQSAIGFSGRQLTNMYIVSFGAFCNIIINLIAIPRIGWRGAVIAAYASEFVMLLLLFTSLVRGRDKEKIII